MPNLFGTVITSGTITPHFDAGEFNFSGSDFNVSGAFHGVGWRLGKLLWFTWMPGSLVTSPEGISIGDEVTPHNRIGGRNTARIFGTVLLARG